MRSAYAGGRTIDLPAHDAIIQPARAQPTLSEGTDCSVSEAPFLGRCGYDTAGKLLQQIYGPLKPRSAHPGGTLLQFDQAPFLSSSTLRSVADHGWAYIPAACAHDAGCRVHVFFHGCEQGYYELDSAGQAENEVAMHSGLNEWADTNRIIVLYPQVWHTWYGPLNPLGCWDWWGYSGDDYAEKSGPLVSMVRAMIDQLASR